MNNQKYLYYLTYISITSLRNTFKKEIEKNKTNLPDSLIKKIIKYKQKLKNKA